MLLHYVSVKSKDGVKCCPVAAEKKTWGNLESADACESDGSSLNFNQSQFEMELIRQ